jgi:hypothetical protein
LDRLVDTLVGTPNCAKELESSFAECDETLYSGNAALDDTAYTAYTAYTDANADTSTETANNDAPEALRFSKIVGASNVPYDDDCEEGKEKVSNVAANLQRFSKSLPLSISSKKSDGTNDIATKNARSYLVEAGEDILIHNETGSVSCSSTLDAAPPLTESVPPQTVQTATPPSKPGTPSCDAPLNNSRAIQEPIPNEAPNPPHPSTATALAALAPTNSNRIPIDPAIVSSVEKLLNEIYGPPRTEFGEQSSLIRAQLIVEKYNSRPDALLRVLEKKAAAKAEVSASEITPAQELNSTPSTPQDGDESQTTGTPKCTPKASNTRSMSFTRRLRSFGRTASKLRSRSIRSNIDHGDNFSTPKKSLRKKQTATTPDTVDENDYSDENETSFDPLCEHWP